MDTCYRLNGIRISYGSRIVLEIEEFEILDRQFYLLTGPNGAGKSTLLSHLALLVAPDKGTLDFGGETVCWNDRALLRLRREITLLHQSPYLFAGSVASNVGYGLKLRGIGGTDLTIRIEKALDLVGLSGFEKRRARELSGGEIQRVALARALALQTRVLLLDEPLANVDQATARKMEDLLLRLPAQGTTVVMTSHDPDHASLPGCNVIHLTAVGQIHAATPHFVFPASGHTAGHSATRLNPSRL